MTPGSLAGRCRTGIRARRRVRRPALALVVAGACAACASPPASGPETQPLADRGVLRGWQHCTDEGCGKNLISAYSTFVFLRVDDRPQDVRPSVILSPGRHWVEAHHSWGVGVITGIGNWRNYGFEIDVDPGHVYTIEDAPAGCIVPASKKWVSPKTLRMADQAPTGERAVREIKAMEFCSPSSGDAGSCRQDSDCPSGTCTPFGGTTGHGLCGTWRD